MNRKTGKYSAGIPHVRQSVLDVLETVEGERVMRPRYGSRLLNSVDDPANPEGRARLLGRIADPINTWEGDRVQLNGVDVTMPEPGHALVYVDGLTDEGRLLIDGAELRPDPRLPASAIDYRSPFLGDTTVAAAMADVIAYLNTAVAVGKPAPVNVYVPAQYTPTVNAAAVRYGSRSVQSYMFEWWLLDPTLVYAQGPSTPYPSYTPPAPVTSPTPNAAAIDCAVSIDGNTDLSTVGSTLQTVLSNFELNLRGLSPKDDTLGGVVAA